MGIISDERLAKLAAESVARRMAAGCTSNRLDKLVEAENVFGRGTREMPGDIPARRRAVARIARALREERRRGKSGHWSYDLNRHIALAQAFSSLSQNEQIWQEPAASSREAPAG